MRLITIGLIAIAMLIGYVGTTNALVPPSPTPYSVTG